MSVKLPFDALVFDLGGVIIPHDNKMLHERLAARCAAPDALDQIRARSTDHRMGTGAITARQLHDELRRDIGYSLDWAGFQADWSCHLGVDHAMLDYVRDLATANRVMLFSNTNEEHWNYLATVTGDALNTFESYLSFRLGMVKPSPDAFRRVAKDAGIEPTRSLFVDDLAENVAAAESVGFHGHVFVGQAELERFLASARP
jgi:putative hydrolase of the HAD superfamily